MKRRALHICFLFLMFAIRVNANESPFYHLRQDVSGRWWLLDGHEKAFYSLGLNTVNSMGDRTRFSNKTPYRDKILEKYGSLDRWANAMTIRFKTWGWNTLGTWTEYEHFHATDFAYTPLMACGKEAPVYKGQKIPDYYSTEFRNYARMKAADVTRDRVNDPKLLGYFLDNELNWGNDYRSQAALFDQYFTFGPNTAGKIALVGQLQEKYKTIESLNRSWKTSYLSFDELRSVTRVPKQRQALEEDRSLFLTRTAETYFQTCSETLRKFDPHHLQLGVRNINISVFPEVLRATARFQDVVSINFYENIDLVKTIVDHTFGKTPLSSDNWLSLFYEIGQKPILISEFGFRSFRWKAPIAWPPIFPVYHSQKARAERASEFMRAVLQRPYIIGVHYFQFIDEPEEGRFDFENSNWGLISIDDEPYPEINQAFEFYNRQIEKIASEARFPN